MAILSRDGSLRLLGQRAALASSPRCWFAARDCERGIARPDVDLGGTPDRCRTRLVDELSRLLRQRRTEAAAVVIPACAGLRLRGRRGSLFGRRTNVLASARNRCDFPFRTAAVRLGRALPAQA